MSKLRQIKRRIKSVEGIAKVTHAMQLVAASRMRRAQENAEMGKSYSEKIKEIMIRLAQKKDGELDPLIDPQYGVKGSTVIAIVFSPQRGLAGSLPGNLARYALRTIHDLEAEGSRVEVITVGSKVRDQLVRRGVHMVADFPDMPEQPTTADTRPILRLVQERYLSGAVREVILVYPKFVNAMIQQPVAKVLLPLNLDEILKFDDQFAVDAVSSVNFLFEPSREMVLSELIPSYLETQLYQAKLETVASEYSARMVAMKNATSNARDMRTYLTLEYNKSRQAQITRELAEISAGRLARGA